MSEQIKNESEITDDQKAEFKAAIERFEPFFEDDTDDEDDFIRSVTFENSNNKIVIYTCVDKTNQEMDWRVAVEERVEDEEGEQTTEEGYILQKKTDDNEIKASYEKSVFYKPKGHSDPDTKEANFDQPFTPAELSAVMNLLQGIEPEKLKVHPDDA